MDGWRDGSAEGGAAPVAEHIKRSDWPVEETSILR
jgi:hypothetical protein